jgi:opacity protein-like surface antigen
MRGSLFGIAATVLIGTPALAADMPLKAPPAAYYNWTGFYAGGEIGGGWATSTTTDLTSGPFPAGFVLPPVGLNGFLGGLYGGYNFQINHFVLGVDGDYTWSHLFGKGTAVSPTTGDIANYDLNVWWIATATGRIGYTNNNWLLFAKAGGAWTGWNGSGVDAIPAGTLQSLTSASETRHGWTVGGGVAYGLTPHISVKLEYDYIGLSTVNFNLTAISATTGGVTLAPNSATSSLNVVKTGVDYRF